MTDEKPRENAAAARWIFDVVVPAQDWSVGKYDLETCLIGLDGKTLQSATLRSGPGG